MEYKRYYTYKSIRESIYIIKLHADSRKDQPSNQKLRGHDQTDHWFLKRPRTRKGVTGMNGQSFHKRLKSQEKGGQPLGSNLALTARAVTFQPPQVTTHEHAKSQESGQQGRPLNEFPPSSVNHCCH